MILAACAPAARYVYERPGVTAEQRQRDEADCQREATITVSGGYGGAYPAFDQSRFNRCMAIRGYEIRAIRQ